MKQTICLLFLFSFSLISFSQEITSQMQNADSECFIIYHSDIEKINIVKNSKNMKGFTRLKPECFWETEDSISDTIIIYTVTIYLSDDCINRISNADWSFLLCCIRIDASSYPIGFVRRIDSFLIEEWPVLYNLSSDWTKFEMFYLKYLRFSFSAEFVQCYPSFYSNLISIQKEIQSAEEYND